MRKTEVPKVTKELDTSLRESHNHVANPLSKLLSATSRDFWSGIDEDSSLLECYVLSTETQLPTFREDRSALILNTGGLHFFEMSVDKATHGITPHKA
jgi:hypothetical protein